MVMVMVMVIFSKNLILFFIPDAVEHLGINISSYFLNVQ